jgi:hypothetical protein
VEAAGICGLHRINTDAAAVEGAVAAQAAGASMTHLRHALDDLIAGIECESAQTTDA